MTTTKTIPSASTGTKLTSQEGFIKFWAKSCLAKTRYYPKKKARKWLRDAEKKTGKKLRIYYCLNCAGYHYSSKEEKND